MRRIGIYHFILAWICATSPFMNIDVNGRCTPLRRCLLILVVLFFRVGASMATSGAGNKSEEVYYYKEQTGATVVQVEWRLKKEDGFTLTYTSPVERHITTIGSDYDTSRWQVHADDGQTDFVAEREDDTIVIRGHFKGAPVDRAIDIDPCPWYQATSLSLRGLATSTDLKRIFWTIRYDTLSAHKVKASKIDIEERAYQGEIRRFQRIRLNLPGILAPFWKSDYWFSLPDGVFHRFEGPSGPPGSPSTTVVIDDE